MQKPCLSAALVMGIVLSATVGAWAATATFDPSQAGTIFAVVNYDRANGRIAPTSVTLDWGSIHRKRTVVPPYQRCNNTSPAGFVVKIRPRGSGNSEPLTLQTTGDIVRSPFQGSMPLEVLHPCYKLVLM
ncbi:MAG TPA: hypothetical protein VJ725_20680 [Thermoanaerobaculia bacterium]|nr:hypothetical protein [Thermoanaerobaculia bacterium]